MLKCLLVLSAISISIINVYAQYDDIGEYVSSRKDKIYNNRPKKSRRGNCDSDSDESSSSSSENESTMKQGPDGAMVIVPYPVMVPSVSYNSVLMNANPWPVLPPNQLSTVQSLNTTTSPDESSNTTSSPDQSSNTTSSPEQSSITTTESTTLSEVEKLCGPIVTCRSWEDNVKKKMKLPKRSAVPDQPTKATDVMTPKTTPPDVTKQETPRPVATTHKTPPHDVTTPKITPTAVTAPKTTAPDVATSADPTPSTEAREKQKKLRHHNKVRIPCPRANPYCMLTLKDEVVLRMQQHFSPHQPAGNGDNYLGNHEIVRVPSYLTRDREWMTKNQVETINEISDFTRNAALPFSPNVDYRSKLEWATEHSNKLPKDDAEEEPDNQMSIPMSMVPTRKLDKSIFEIHRTLK